MTLIVNEIHLLDGLNKTMLVAAADQRISNPDGSFKAIRKKLLRIPYLSATISYFGLASVYPKSKEQYLSDWLPHFINAQSGVPDLQTFVQNLRDALQRVIPKSTLRDYASGFHISGYNSQGLPEFWHLTNIGGMRGFQYVDLKPRYGPPSPDFLERDAQKNWGWDGSDPSSAKNGVQTYRNGDFRAHVVAWKVLDKIIAELAQFPAFKIPSNPGEYGQWVKFKFEFIAYLYKQWANKEIIARPIDVCVMHRGFGDLV